MATKAELRRYERDRKRLQRAAKRVAGSADLPPAPAMPGDLLGWAGALTVTQGEHAGDLLTVLPWQADYLRDVDAAAGGEYGLSIAAGAGKTTLAATVAAAGVAGPLAQPRADVLLVAGIVSRKRCWALTMRRRSCAR